jgi:serine/threonine protein phosphatase PrpC
MLCSDGVSDGVDQDAIQRLLSGDATPQQQAEAIVKAAEDGGSRDNITCVVVHVA